MILDGLEDPDPIYRKVSLGALTRITAGESDWSNVLERALDDPDSRVRVEALSRMKSLSSGEFDRKSALLVALADPDSSVRKAAATSAMKNRDSLEDQVSILTAALVDSFASVRTEALRSKVVHKRNKRERATRPFVDAALASLTDPSAGVRSAAVNFLREVGDVYPKVLPRLFEATKDEAATVREFAFLSLCNYSKHTPGLVSCFVRGLGDSDRQVRTNAASGLVQCHTSTWGGDSTSPEPWPETVVPALRAALHDESHYVWGSAISALVLLLPDDTVMEILLDAMTTSTTGTEKVRGRILAGLIEVAPSIEDAIELTLRAMSIPTRSEQVFQIAGYFAEVDERLKDQILLSIEDPDREIRKAAVLGIAEMDPFFAEPESLLRYLTQDSDERVRKVAERNLKSVTEYRGVYGNQFDYLRKNRVCQLPSLDGYSRP